MGAYNDMFLRRLADLEAVSTERTFVELNMSSLFLNIMLGEEWHNRCVALNNRPDPWMLNGNLAWLTAHPVADPDMRRLIYTQRVIRLCDAFFTLTGKVAGFERLRQRFLARDATRASFAEAEIASLLVHNGCSVQIVGETGVRGQDFDLLATVHGVPISVEVTSIQSGNLSVRAILNKLKHKRNQVPKNRPAVLYILVPESWMRNYQAAFLIFNEAITRFVRKSRRINIFVLVWESMREAPGGGTLHRLLQPVFSDRSRWAIPDRTLFTLKRDQWGQSRYSKSFLNAIMTLRFREQIEQT